MSSCPTKSATPEAFSLTPVCVLVPYPVGSVHEKSIPLACNLLGGSGVKGLRGRVCRTGFATIRQRSLAFERSGSWAGQYVG